MTSDAAPITALIVNYKVYDELASRPLHQRPIDRARRVVVERGKLIGSLAPCGGDFYSRRECLDIAQRAGVSPDPLSLIDLGRDWVAVIRAGR
jgi:hypothetical protein